LIGDGPLLICDWFKGAEAVSEVSAPALIRATAVGTWQLQRQLLFDDRWDNGAYSLIVGPCLDKASTPVVHLGVPFLELRHACKPVEITFPDGTILVPFPFPVA
jgi:hypothetical protein